MNIGFMFFSALVTTIGLIIITEFAGRKQATSVKQFLAFLALAPFLSILLKLLFDLTINPGNTAAATEASEKTISMLPEEIISGYIGDVVGLVVWGIYRQIKILF